MYNFDRIFNRIGTGSVKWEVQDIFGAPNGLLPFWVADTDFETLPEIIQAIKRRCDHPLFGYTAAQKDCLEAVSGWQGKRNNWDIDISWIVPSAGVVTAISFTIQALTNPGDRILIFSPVYDPFFKVIKNTNRRLVDLQLLKNGNTYNIDFGKLEKELAAGVRAIILCNPHNPVGRVWSKRELGEIAGLCRKYNVYILSDDVHGDIIFPGNEYTPIAKIKEAEDLSVTFTAISKTFNMAGLASSTLIIPDPDIRTNVARALKNAFIMGPNAIALTAIEAAYRHGDAYVDQLNAYISANASFVADYFAENMPDVGVTKTEGTFLMWLDFNCLGLTCNRLSEIMVKEYRLALSKGTTYGSQAEGFMRLNIGCPRSMLEKGITLINRLYKNRRRHDL
ncbi:MAG: pyridoxal phosphate-dependent aminotransferase [Deltaproteobacteria bacterium]|nr:pyridoxal phosphate-dependent aminotransferase [Deltaproteobacteria bacterium]